MLIEIFQTEIQKEKRITKTKSRREYQSIMGQFQKVWHKHNWNARRRKENRREEMPEKEFLKIIDKYQTTNPKT